MHMPTFGQVATIGMALFAAAAIAAPVAQPLEADVVEVSSKTNRNKKFTDLIQRSAEIVVSVAI